MAIPFNPANRDQVIARAGNLAAAAVNAGNDNAAPDVMTSIALTSAALSLHAQNLPDVRLRGLFDTALPYPPLTLSPAADAQARPLAVCAGELAAHWDRRAEAVAASPTDPETVAEQETKTEVLRRCAQELRRLAVACTVGLAAADDTDVAVVALAIHPDLVDVAGLPRAFTLGQARRAVQALDAHRANVTDRF